MEFTLPLTTTRQLNWKPGKDTKTTIGNKHIVGTSPLSECPDVLLRKMYIYFSLQT
jgi:hypothetical protein